MNGIFSPLNLAILFAYLGAMLWIGIRLAGRQTSTREFFLAGRNMPWLIVAMSMYASLTSAVTYMALPAMAYRENVAFVVVCFISPLVAPFLIRIFYPFYQRLGVTTSYEYIGQRFGLPARMAVSALFILARLGWLGTVIFAPALTLSVTTALPLTAAILIMGAIATGYTFLGGIAADIWTDVIQFVIMIAGAIWVALTLVQAAPGGIPEIITLARDTGHLQIASWHFSWFEMTGWVVAITFFFQLMQDYGTDQCTVQRLMTTPTLRGIRRAIVFNAAVDFFIIGLLLFIGLGLFNYNRLHPDVFPADLRSDALLPYYIIHALPDGVSGLLVTAILAAAMSSMDSGISSLSTVVVNDFVKPLAAENDPRDLALGRWLTLIFGVFATGVALAIAHASRFSHLVETYTTIISLFSAPILALFLLGMLTRHGHFVGWLIGTAVSIPTTLWLQHGVGIHWVYFFPASFLVTFGIGIVASLFCPRRPLPPGLMLWEKPAA